METRKPWWRWGALAAALAFLNTSLTFHNIWPTPAIRWQGELSLELAACALMLVFASRWLGPPSRAALRALAGLWLLLVLGRYAEITAPALYGRDVNLYWDLQHVSGVAAMLARAAPLRLLLLAGGTVILTLFLLYILVRWALAQLGEATASARGRRAVALMAAAALALFVAERAGFPGGPRFSTPVTQTYARQARLVLHAHAAQADPSVLAPSPQDALTRADLSLVKGADVLLLFIESYGAVSYENPEFAKSLAANRKQLDAAIHDTNREVVSAYVESPTFGGSSWLAHISLLSGIEVRDPDPNALLMTQKRDTLITTFARRGYRTVAVMPGMWQAWPEGAFYGFDDIYGGARLDYRGPGFGWWDIPDQFAIARMDALEVSRASRAPLFVFFPTISTHVPFCPTPPYQPDWRRLLTGQPYDAADLERAFGSEPDWLNLGPSYVRALAYADDSLAGYLRQRADHDFIMIVLGDHQPPAAVSGEGAPWNVPVHVVANRTGRRAVLERLLAQGFHEGLTPQRPAIGRMHALLPVLLDAFGNREAGLVAAR